MAARFIVLEGPDGVGKTVQAHQLANALRERGLDVVETREPTNVGPIGPLIRSALATTPSVHGLDWRAMTLLFSADRAWHLRNVIEPALEAGKSVICDRYYLSTAVYQTAPLWLTYKRAGHGADYASELFTMAGRWIMEVNQWCLAPDLTLILHSDGAQKRRATRGAQDAYDSDSELQAAVAMLYRSPERWIGGERVQHIDGDGNQDEVAARVLRACGAAVATLDLANAVCEEETSARPGPFPSPSASECPNCGTQTNLHFLGSQCVGCDKCHKWGSQ